MELSVLPKDEVRFLRVCHHISNAVYLLRWHCWSELCRSHCVNVGTSV